MATTAPRWLDKARLRALARRRARAGRRLAGTVWKQPFRALPSDRPLARFLRGLLLPFGLMRATWRVPEQRTRWLRVCALQALVVLAVGLPIGIPATMQEIHQWRTGEGGKLTVDLTGVTIVVVLAWVEWCVIALSRQFHDQIGRTASLEVGVPPEDPERQARVTLDLRWVWNKIKRRSRAFKAWAVGLPAIVIFALVPGVGPVLVQGLLLAWTLFWFACGAAGKTAYAWRTEDVAGAPDPFFLRTASALKDRVPLFGWWLPRAYFALWRRFTLGLFPPVREVEARGYEFIGLAVARVLMGTPVVYLFVRPFFPVAAAELVLRELSPPRGEGARRSSPPPALVSGDRQGPLVDAPTSPERMAVEKHREDRED